MEREKKRILFVDDEANVLAGLRNLLRKRRNEWSMDFVQGGELAIETLAKQTYDVVVSDMRMPQVDGAQLLKHVKDNFPNTVRIVLSGFTELESAMKLVPVAHQFLAKPCDADHLRSVIERACNLHSLLHDESLQKVVGNIDHLPSPPDTYLELLEILGSPMASLKDVVAVVERDVALSAKMLQLVNSAFFGQAQRTSNIQRAVSLLGANMVKNVVLGLQSYGKFKIEQRIPGFSIGDEELHGVRVGRLAQSLLKGKSMQIGQDAMVAGMMHDIGKLVIAVNLPKRMRETFQHMEENNCSMHEAETTLYGVTHAEVGAYLLGLWGIPYPIVEAVANHHRPEFVGSKEFDVLAAVYVADVLVESSMESGKGLEALDNEFLSSIGMTDKIEDWLNLAEEVIAGAA